MTKRPDTGAQLAHVGFYSGSFTVMNGSVKVEGGPAEALVSADGQVLFSAASDGFTDAAGGAKGTLVGTKFTASVGGAPITGSIDASHKITATFRTEKVQGAVAPAGTSQVTLEGTLSFHGADHKMSLPAKVAVENGRVQADTQLQIPYVQWGLHDPSIFVLRVAKVVDVKVHAVGTLATVGGASAGTK